MRLFTHQQIVSILADAYYEAARQNVDMRMATHVLETIRTALLSQQNFLTLWNLFDNEVGQVGDGRLQSALVKLRSNFEQAVRETTIRQLDEQFQEDDEAGWQEWLQTYVTALNEWRLTFCLDLARAPLPFPKNLEPSIAEIQQYTQRMLHQRWAETYDWFLYLSRQEFPPRERARLLVAVGEIELYQFLRPDKANAYFEQAEQLASDDRRVVAGWGEYWFQRDDTEKAMSYFRRVIEIAPDRDEGYVNLGDCYEKRSELEAAEEQYQQAITQNPGSTAGYTRLIRLYGRREWFSSHHERLPELVRRIQAVYPPDSYSALLEEGAVYQQNKLYDEAHQRYDEAITLDNSALLAYISHGYAFLDEALDINSQTKTYQECLEGAQANFEKAIDVALQAMEGYWGMVWLCEQQGQWLEALAWCEKSLARRPQWESIILARKGEIWRRQEDFNQAEADLMRVLEIEPDNRQALNSLATLAEDYYQKGNDPDSALRVFQTVRQRRGQSYEADYRNLVGNLKYYYGDYTAAADYYRQAIAANDEEPVFHSNLALALVRLKRPGNRLAELNETIAALRQAIELAPDLEKYHRRLQDLEREQRFIQRYGEPGLQYKPLVTPIHVFVEDAFLKHLLDDGMNNLSSQTLQLTEALRNRIQEQYGFAIPRINFTEWPEADAPPGTYRFTLMGEFSEDGRVTLDKKFAILPKKQQSVSTTELPPFNSGRWLAEVEWAEAAAVGRPLWTANEYMIYHLESFLRQYLELFINHQTTMNLLDACIDEICETIKSSPPLLTILTLVLRTLLQQRIPVVAFTTICEHVVRMNEDGAGLSDIVQQLRTQPELS